MPRETIKQVLMRRDGMPEDEVDELLLEAQEEFDERMEAGDDLSDFCEEMFGLEPDYLDEFLGGM